MSKDETSMPDPTPRGPLAYQPPVLRPHGALRDLTTQFPSGYKPPA